MALKIIFEGRLDITKRVQYAMVGAQPGTIVALDKTNSGKLVICDGTTMKPYGLLAQPVVDANKDNFKLDTVTLYARVSSDDVRQDKAGVYFQHGMYYTDNTATSVAIDDNLYCDAAGKFTTVSNSGGVVAKAHTAGSAGQQIQITLNI